jgi:flagellar biosynthetic protein FliO
MEMVLVRTVLSLGAVLALMLGVLYLVRRYVQGGSRSTSHLVEVELLGQRALGPRRSIQVLKVLDRVLVVGVSEQGMQALAELSGEQAMNELNERRQALEQGQGRSWKHGAPARLAQGFGAHLRAALGVRPHGLAPSEEGRP